MSYMKIVWYGLFIIALMFGFNQLFTKYTQHRRDSQEIFETASALGKIQNASPTITVYSPPGNPVTYQALTLLSMHGFQSQLIPMSNTAEIRTHFPSLSDDDISTFTMPLFLLPNGLLASTHIFYSALHQLPIIDFHAGKTKPYLIIYGLENCPYTKNAKNELDKYGIPYEYININQDAAKNIGEIEAKFSALGIDGSEISTPIIEVNGSIGFVRDNSMSVSTAITKYNE